MESNWASDNLQTIRTLMERSALYRRALAPMMLATGAVGLVAAAVGFALKYNSTRSFTLFWFGVSIVAIVASFVLVRRQALKDSEAIWSLPTRRVAQALLPNLFLGAVAGVLLAFAGGEMNWRTHYLPPIWITLYACAIHSAGFFMTRGIKLFAWISLLCGTVLLAWLASGRADSAISPHWIMGTYFGAGHLAYGVYLYFTEPRKNAA